MWASRPAICCLEDGELTALGRHLLIDLHGCRPRTLDDVDAVRSAALEVADKLGARVLGVTEHVFEPQGVTVIVAIAESHVSVHTWPEHDYAAVDVFTCGPGLSRETIDGMVSALGERLGARQTTALEVKRGIVLGAIGAMDVARLSVGEDATLDPPA